MGQQFLTVGSALELLYVQSLLEHVFIEGLGQFFHEFRIHVADGRHVVVKAFHQHLAVGRAHAVQSPSQPPDGILNPGAVHGVDVSTAGAAPLATLDLQLEVHHALVAQQDLGFVVLVLARAGQEDAVSF